jgi:hypothetical protein
MPDDKTLTEYSRLAATARLKRPRIAELSSSDAAALAKETKLPVQRVRTLVASEKLAGQAGLPAELIYGVTSKMPAKTLDDLLTRPPEDLRAAYAEAIGEGVIAPLEDATAHALDRLVALSAERIPVATIGGAALKRSASLNTLLKRERISTLADLRSSGGLSFREDLSEADRAIAGRLDAHARLLSLVPDVGFTSKLVAGGYATLAAVARATPREIAEHTGAAIDAPMVKEVIARARDQVGLIQSLGYGAAAVQATGLQRVGPGGTGGGIGTVLGQS